MAEVEYQYAIEWLEPAELKGSVTRYFTKERALHHLELCGRLPGKMKGRLVQRTITISDWRELNE